MVVHSVTNRDYITIKSVLCQDLKSGPLGHPLLDQININQFVYVTAV